MEERIAALEAAAVEGRAARAELREMLQSTHDIVIELKGWLGGNGSMTASIKEGRIRFAGSMSVRNSSLLGTGAVGGIIAVILKALGWY